MSPDQWRKLKQEEQSQKAKKNFAAFGPRGFQSRSLQSFQQDLEKGKANHLLPMTNAKEKLKSGAIKSKDIPYMQRTGKFVIRYVNFLRSFRENLLICVCFQIFFSKVGHGMIRMSVQRKNGLMPTKSMLPMQLQLRTNFWVQSNAVTAKRAQLPRRILLHHHELKSYLVFSKDQRKIAKDRSLLD